MMDTPVFYHESFANLIMIMAKLKIIGIRHHKIAPTFVLQGAGIDPAWIPIPVMGLYAEFIEVTGIKVDDDIERTKT